MQWSTVNNADVALGLMWHSRRLTGVWDTRANRGDVWAHEPGGRNLLSARGGVSAFRSGRSWWL